MKPREIWVLAWAMAGLYRTVGKRAGTQHHLGEDSAEWRVTFPLHEYEDHGRRADPGLLGPDHVDIEVRRTRDSHGRRAILSDEYDSELIDEPGGRKALSYDDIYRDAAPSRTRPLRGRNRKRKRKQKRLRKIFRPVPQRQSSVQPLEIATKKPHRLKPVVDDFLSKIERFRIRLLEEFKKLILLKTSQIPEVRSLNYSPLSSTESPEVRRRIGTVEKITDISVTTTQNPVEAHVRRDLSQTVPKKKNLRSNEGKTEVKNSSMMKTESRSLKLPTSSSMEDSHTTQLPEIPELEIREAKERALFGLVKTIAIEQNVSNSTTEKYLSSSLQSVSKVSRALHKPTRRQSSSSKGIVARSLGSKHYDSKLSSTETPVKPTSQHERKVPADCFGICTTPTMCRPCSTVN